MDAEEAREYSERWENRQLKLEVKKGSRKADPAANQDMFKVEPEKPDKPDSAGCADMAEFLKSISKIEKVKAVTAKDGATWNFTISVLEKTERIIISNRDLMKGSWTFEDFKTWGEFMLKYSNVEWSE